MKRIPKKKSGYSKQVMYIMKDKFNPLKINYFDRRGELLKTANFKGYKKFMVKKKSLWRPSSIHMKNVQTKKESIFQCSNRTYDNGLGARVFNKNSLK